MSEATGEAIVEHSTRAVEIAGLFQRLAHQKSNITVVDGWASLLGVPSSSEEFYSMLASVAGSLSALKEEIKGSRLRPASQQHYLEAVEKISRYVKVQNLSGLQIVHLRSEAEALRLLTLLDDVLEPMANRQLTREQLDEWLAQLDDLVSTAKDAFDDPALRQFVIRQITTLQWAIRNYDILGIDGISKAYGVMLAEVARSQGMRGAKTSSAKGWYRRAKGPILALGVAIAATSAVVEKADNLLTHGGHIYEVVTDQAQADGSDGETDATAASAKKRT